MTGQALFVCQRVRDILPLALHPAMEYPWRMSKWLCALMLVLFAATIGLAGQTPAQKDSEYTGVAQMVPPAHCCSDTHEMERSAAPCSAECCFLPAAPKISLPRSEPSHCVSRDVLPHSVASGRLHRPPIG